MRLVTLSRAFRKNSPTWGEVGHVPATKTVAPPDDQWVCPTLYTAVHRVSEFRGNVIVVTLGPFVVAHRNSIARSLRPALFLCFQERELVAPIEHGPSRIWLTALDVAFKHLGPSAYDWIDAV